MDHSNSHHEHSNHQPIDTAAAEQHSRNNNDDVPVHQYAINHQPQHYYYQQQHQQQNNYYGMQQHQPNHQPASWQWMPVAIPPPPPPPPNSFLPSQIAVPSPDTLPSQLHQGEPQKPQTKRVRKRRWGPVLNEEQTTPNEQSNETEHHPGDVSDSANNIGTKDSEMSKETNSTDCAIDAINALSTLQSRWNGPSQKKKRKRGRRRKKKTNNKAESSNQESEIADNVWIDVDDVVKIMNPHQSSVEQSGDCSKDLDGLGVTGNTNQQNESVEEKSEMSTAELQSYANVLKRALDGTSKTQPSIDDGGDDNSEMDISDDEEDEDSFINTLSVFSSDTFREERTTDQSEADRDKREKEKRALKLAELKAKAKLANAKLRMAMQRKALGTNGRKTPPVLNETMKLQHSSKLPGLQDISALRNITTLVIPNVRLTGADDMVRFVHSVYDLSSDDDFSSESDDNSLTPSPPESEVTLPNVSQKKSHQSLKQQLQLAKLRLEIKRKEQLLLEKKKTAPATIASDTTNDACLENSEGKCAVINNGSNLTISSENKKVQLEQLRRRQKELKQKNEVSNLKNLINRQRKLLRAKGQELSESSKQLENIDRDISSKQKLLDESNKRLEEMQHRKRIMERMIIKATEKVMTARKALNQHKLQK